MEFVGGWSCVLTILVFFSDFVVAPMIAELCTVDSPYFLLSNSGEPHVYRLVIVGLRRGWGRMWVGGLCDRLLAGSINVISYLIYMQYVYINL